MDALVITWRELLVVVILVLAVYVAEMLLFIRSGGQRPRIRLWQNKDTGGGASAREIRVLREEVGELRDELAEMRGELEVLKNIQVSGNSPYTQAIQMAREGSSAGEVAETCGISRGEAELIVAMHRGDAP